MNQGTHSSKDLLVVATLSSARQPATDTLHAVGCSVMLPEASLAAQLQALTQAAGQPSSIEHCMHKQLSLTKANTIHSRGKFVWYNCHGRYAQGKDSRYMI